MMKPQTQKPSIRPVGVDGATLIGDVIVSGLVRTSKGWGLLIATLMPSGEVSKISIGPSQDYRHGKRFIAEQHVRFLASQSWKNT